MFLESRKWAQLSSPVTSVASKTGKSFVTIVGYDGLDINPSGYQNLNRRGKLWRDSHLTSLSCFTYPAGRSIFSPIEDAWSPLSNALTGVTLPANKLTFVIRSGK